MKKLLLLIFTFVFLSQSFAQHNIDYKFKVRYHHSFGWSTITVAEGSFTEGTPYTIPDFSMSSGESSLQAAYNAVAGATFGIDSGALNNDIKIEITLDGLNLSSGLFESVGGETLFLVLDVDVYSPADSPDPVEGHFWFNTGHPMMFRIPRQPNFDNFVNSIGLNPDALAFAYLDADQFFPQNIETLITSEHIWFLADHLSTFGGGRQDLVGVEEEANDAIPSVYALEQNYPNPFNPTTNIKFSLPESGNVTIKIYNTLGSEITTLISENMTAGNHTATFNATNLPSGIYFYTLNSNNISLTKKMLLLK